MKRNNSTIIFIAIFVLFVFQKLIQIYLPVFSSFDEFFSLLCIPISIIYILTNIKKFNASKNSAKIILLLFIIVVIGLFSNFIYEYQPIKIVLSDLLVFMKFYLMYFFSRIYITENKIKDISVRRIISIITIIFVILTFIDFRYNIYNHHFYKGFMENQLFFGHATYLVAACVFLLITNLLFKSNYFSKTNILLILLILSSMKGKAIGFIVAYILLYFLVYKRKVILNVSKIMVIAFVCIIFAYDKITTYYFVNDGFARQELTVKSFEIAKDHFPFGTGFGTYGSFFSSVNYSPVYYQYHLSRIYGLQPNNTMFIADTFWPMIIGQFGIVGTLLYLLIIYYLYKNINDEFEKDNVNKYLAKLLGLIYLLISSTSETAFVNPMAIPIAMIMGIWIKKR